MIGSMIFFIVSGQQCKILLANFINKLHFHLSLTITVKKQVLLKSIGNIKNKINLVYSELDPEIYYN